jgi:hypothetical protein
VERWDEWGGKGERNYLVVKRVKRGGRIVEKCVQREAEYTRIPRI